MNVPSVTGRCVSFVGRVVSRDEFITFMRSRYPHFSQGVSDQNLVAYAMCNDIAAEFDGKLFFNEEAANV